jgi:hypothetical protein
MLAGIIALLASATSVVWQTSFAATLSADAPTTAPATLTNRGDRAHADFLASAGELLELGPVEAERVAVSGSLPSPALMSEIAAWLADNFDLPPTDELPQVELTPPKKLVTIRLGGFVANQPETTSEPNPPQPPLDIAGDLVAIYNSAKRIIYLPEGWSGKSPDETSILVHEMVHHLQNVGALKYPCPDAREKPAYLAQDRWLRRFDLDLETAFGLDLFTIFVRSACFH